MLLQLLIVSGLSRDRRHHFLDGSLEVVEQLEDFIGFLLRHLTRLAQRIDSAKTFPIPGASSKRAGEFSLRHVPVEIHQQVPVLDQEEARVGLCALILARLLDHFKKPAFAKVRNPDELLSHSEEGALRDVSLVIFNLLLQGSVQQGKGFKVHPRTRLQKLYTSSQTDEQLAIFFRSALDHSL